MCVSLTVYFNTKIKNKQRFGVFMHIMTCFDKLVDDLISLETSALFLQAIYIMWLTSHFCFDNCFTHLHLHNVNVCKDPLPSPLPTGAFREVPILILIHNSWQERIKPCFKKKLCVDVSNDEQINKAFLWVSLEASLSLSLVGGMVFHLCNK